MTEQEIKEVKQAINLAYRTGQEVMKEWAAIAMKGWHSMPILQERIRNIPIMEKLIDEQAVTDPNH